VFLLYNSSTKKHSTKTEKLNNSFLHIYTILSELSKNRGTSLKELEVCKLIGKKGRGGREGSGRGGGRTTGRGTTIVGGREGSGGRKGGEEIVVCVDIFECDDDNDIPETTSG
jgi:hypothetical protein